MSKCGAPNVKEIGFSIISKSVNDSFPLLAVSSVASLHTMASRKSDFKYSRLLGKGSYGSVYKCIRNADGLECVLPY